MSRFRASGLADPLVPAYIASIYKISEFTPGGYFDSPFFQEIPY